MQICELQLWTESKSSERNWYTCRGCHKWDFVSGLHYLLKEFLFKIKWKLLHQTHLKMEIGLFDFGKDWIVHYAYLG